MMRRCNFNFRCGNTIVPDEHLDVSDSSNTIVPDEHLDVSDSLLSVALPWIHFTKPLNYLYSNTHCK